MPGALGWLIGDGFSNNNDSEKHSRQNPSGPLPVSADASSPSQSLAKPSSSFADASIVYSFAAEGGDADAN